MVSAELSTPEADSQVVVMLRGDLDVTEAAGAAASLAIVAASARTVIVDLGGTPAAIPPEAGNPALLAAPSHLPSGLLAAGDAA